MSVAVELANLQERVGEYGPLALLVTISADNQPHIVSVAVELSDGVLVADVGKTTAANAGRVPSVSMLWPGPSGGDYCLIVDGAASLEEGAAGHAGSRVLVRPTRAVLHRLANASDTLPSCVTVLDQRPNSSG